MKQLVIAFLFLINSLTLAHASSQKCPIKINLNSTPSTGLTTWRSDVDHSPSVLNALYKKGYDVQDDQLKNNLPYFILISLGDGFFDPNGMECANVQPPVLDCAKGSSAQVVFFHMKPESAYVVIKEEYPSRYRIEHGAAAELVTKKSSITFGENSTERAALEVIQKLPACDSL
jgi:hypothetical protein